MGKVHMTLLEMKHCKTSQPTICRTLRAKRPSLRTQLSLTGIPSAGCGALGWASHHCCSHLRSSDALSLFVNV